MIYCKNKLAVCVLTHNRINYLKKTIDSVLNSSLKEYDLIVINDVSRDGTDEYLEALENKGVLKEVRHNKNFGQFKNANYILSNVVSEYCIILHDDDILEPDHLKEVLDLAQSDKDISIVATGWNGIDEKDEITITNIYPEFSRPVILKDKEFFYHHFKGLYVQWSGTLIRMDKVKDIRFDEKHYKELSDIIFLNNLAIGNRIGYIPRPLLSYRIHESQITAKLKQECDIYYERWTRVWDFYEGLIINNNYEEEYMKNFKIARNKTLFWLLIVLTGNFKTFFKILFSDYFSFYLLNPIQWLRLFNKLRKLCFAGIYNLFH